MVQEVLLCQKTFGTNEHGCRKFVKVEKRNSERLKESSPWYLIDSSFAAIQLQRNAMYACDIQTEFEWLRFLKF